MLKVLLAFTVTVQLAYSQSIIKGKVLDQSDRKPIAYANIGIVNTSVGTISNEDGTFSLKVSDQNKNDSVLFSAIGYGRKNISVQSITAHDLTILLEEKPAHLNEVTITSSKEKNRHFELGNSKYKGGVLETDTTYAGSSTALLIENKNPYQKDLIFPVYLERARIRIYRNNLLSFKLRIRLYSVDSLTNYPGEDLLDKSLVVESSMRNGWLEFDLSSFRFLISKPFFVAFERILTQNDRTEIANGYKTFKQNNPDKVVVDTLLFEGKKIAREMLKGGGIDLPGTFIGIAGSDSTQQQHSCFVRKTSFDKWEKVRGILTATVIVAYRLE